MQSQPRDRLVPQSSVLITSAHVPRPHAFEQVAGGGVDGSVGGGGDGGNATVRGATGGDGNGVAGGSANGAAAAGGGRTSMGVAGGGANGSAATPVPALGSITTFKRSIATFCAWAICRSERRMM